MTNPAKNGNGSLRLSNPEPDIGVITIDMPDKGANILSTSVLDELDETLNQLTRQRGLAGLIVTSGKPGTFIAGADLREFAASLDIDPLETVRMCRRGQILFSRLSKLPFVTVAAIDGICVGGGAELAAWCDRRVMTENPKTEFGFPEVKLGLFPGWGGTARAPRMVGLGNAVEMITGGESISASEALKMGWVSSVVKAENLMASATNMIRSEQKTKQYLKDRAIWSGPLHVSDTEMGFLGITASAMIQQQTKGQYPAPMAALETMMAAASVDVEAACVMEAEAMSKLFGSPINAALLNVFFLTDRNKKDTGVRGSHLEPAPIHSAAVVGAGIMGAGIAAANVKRAIFTALTDTRAEALAQGVRTVLSEVAFNKETRQADVDRAVQLAPLLNGTVTQGEVASADVVIEAVVEKADIKRQIYRNLEPLMRDDAILASNTSTIPITQLADGLKHPERFCGIHFFNPVRKMKLVEVIRGNATDDQTVVTAVAYAKSIGKSPIVVNDGPGFLVNRLLLPYMNEALELLAEGVPIPDIEKASKNFGMPMGPINLYDMVGLDTALYAGKVLSEAFPDRIHASPILSALVNAGRLGQKSGAGFYSYDNKKRRPEHDPKLDQYLDPLIRRGGAKRAPPPSRQEITNRLFLPMLLEATRVLQENIVRDPRDIDLGMIFGTGFPPFKGGLMFWADCVGAAKIVEMLKPLEHLGPRAKPTHLLLELAQSGGKFYDMKN